MKTTFVVEVEFKLKDEEAALAATDELIGWFLEHVGECQVEMVETTCHAPEIVHDHLPAEAKETLKKRFANLSSCDALNRLWEWLSLSNLIPDDYEKYSTQEIVDTVIDEGDGNTLHNFMEMIGELEKLPKEKEE